MEYNFLLSSVLNQDLPLLVHFSEKTKTQVRILKHLNQLSYGLLSDRSSTSFFSLVFYMLVLDFRFSDENLQILLNILFFLL